MRACHAQAEAVNAALVRIEERGEGCFLPSLGARYQVIPQSGLQALHTMMKTFHGPILIFARQRTSLDNLLLLLPLIVNMEAPNRVLISRQQFTETLSGEIKTIYKIDPSERSTGPDRSTDPGAVSGPTLGCVMTRYACSLRSHLVLDPRVGFSHLRTSCQSNHTKSSWRPHYPFSRGKRLKVFTARGSCICVPISLRLRMSHSFGGTQF